MSDNDFHPDLKLATRLAPRGMTPGSPSPKTWLDGATALPAGTTKAVGWTPTDWVDNTLETWKRLCDPMAQQISTVRASSLPEEAKSMAGPLLAMMSQMGGMAFGSQLGQALGRLSGEVLTSTDIGLPLGPGIGGGSDDGYSSVPDVWH